MSSFSSQQVDAFFSSIAEWRRAYRRARLHFVAVEFDGQTLIVAARMFLHAVGEGGPKKSFRSGRIVAGEWDLQCGADALEANLSALMSKEGFVLEGGGSLRLPTDERTEIFASPPALLHPEGVNAGNRLAVLSVYGSNWQPMLPQPETDWLLKAAEMPYDSLNELLQDFGLGQLRQERTLVEVIASHAVEVLGQSAVKGTSATVGLWMSDRLDRANTRLGYRVLSKGKVVLRGAVSGSDLSWHDEQAASVGQTSFDVPEGGVVQCIASYGGHAHHVAWRADPATFLNPRAAVLNLVDPNMAILQAYLAPDLNTPSKTRADDFESAVTWLLWTLGFSTIAFGTNSKTRDTFDVVAATPSGDFLVVECTTGMLRAESKLSKLIARVSNMRESLREAGHHHLRVLAVAVTALRDDQVVADVAPAEEAGVLVLTREVLLGALDQMAAFPDADTLYQRGVDGVNDRQQKRKSVAAAGAEENGLPTLLSGVTR